MNLPTYMFLPSVGVAGLLSLFVAVILPLMVGLLTKLGWPARTKALILIVLASVKTVVEAVIFSANEGVPFAPYPFLLTAFANLVIAIAIHFGVWKPTGVSDMAQNSLVK